MLPDWSDILTLLASSLSLRDCRRRHVLYGDVFVCYLILNVSSVDLSTSSLPFCLLSPLPLLRRAPDLPPLPPSFLSLAASCLTALYRVLPLLHVCPDIDFVYCGKTLLSVNVQGFISLPINHLCFYMQVTNNNNNNNVVSCM